MKIFDIIQRKAFFSKYAKGVLNWKHKMRGKNGRGNPVEFTDQDKEQIKKGLQKLIKDF